jgi:hypothetical protein
MNFSVTCILIFVPFLLLPGWVGGQVIERRSGAFALMSSKGSVQLALPGGDCQPIEPTSWPYYYPGLVQLEFGSNSQSVWTGSNLLSCYQRGRGILEVERFEQNNRSGFDFWSESREQGFSRMILGLRLGEFLFDTRALSAASQLFVELPFVRVLDGRGLWSVQVAEQEFKGAYRIRIRCREGVLRVKNQVGEKYELRAGQVLTVQGRSNQLDFSVAALAPRDEVDFERAIARLPQASQQLLKAALAREHMPLIQSFSDLETELASDFLAMELSDNSENQKPILIEYQNPVAAVLPFRGVRSFTFSPDRVDKVVLQAQ